MRNRKDIETQIGLLKRHKANAEHLLSEAEGNIQQETISKTMLANIDGSINALEWCLELKTAIPLETNQYSDFLAD